HSASGIYVQTFRCVFLLIISVMGQCLFYVFRRSVSTGKTRMAIKTAIMAIRYRERMNIRLLREYPGEGRPLLLPIGKTKPVNV
ncbi:hypothetical protein N4Q65_14970, partial [Salmonella enterica subsp. enterica serovar Pomona]